MGCSASSATTIAQAKKKGDVYATIHRDSDPVGGEDEGHDSKLEFLSQVPLMARLRKGERALIAAACIVQDFSKGSHVIRQGEQGHEFFVIRSGEATVNVRDSRGDTTTVAVLTAGDYFGESALLHDEERGATITAETPLSTFKLSRTHFEALHLHENLLFATRRAVGGGAQKAHRGRPPTPKTSEQRRFIAKAIMANENLRVAAMLDDARAQSMVELMWKEEVPEGKSIIVEGDMPADFFYVVQDGCFEISVSDEVGAVGTVSAGGSFGELAMLYFAPRAATVKATAQSTVWVIDRANFKGILMRACDDTLLEYTKYLDGVRLLQSVPEASKISIAKALVEMHFRKGETVIQQVEPGNTFYIMYHGAVDIIKDGELVVNLTASSTRSSAQYFGEAALLADEKRGATVRVTSETAKTLVLDRQSFQALLGPHRAAIELDWQDALNAMGRVTQAKESSPMVSEAPRVRLPLEDLERIGLLGCGGFGTVELFGHKVTQETYAMKGISKGYILEAGLEGSIMNEKNILFMVSSDFVVKLHETYNSGQMLYFLLEPALGGELYATYYRKGLHGSVQHCLYYTAGTVFALEHLHKKRIVYRDLKPENLLLTDKGHIKLTDMGLAKVVYGKAFSTCGTPDYFAPELIASTGHTKALDWWTLGVLVFELMSGHTPFQSTDPMRTYAKVRRGIEQVPFPPGCQGPAADFVRQLLRQDPCERLPMRAGGMRNLKSHKWFEGFDWEAMGRLALPAPYEPVVKSKRDLGNFCANSEDMPKIVEYRDPGTGWDRGFATA